MLAGLITGALILLAALVIFVRGLTARPPES
jgi:hypothetical protein